MKVPGRVGIGGLLATTLLTAGCSLPSLGRTAAESTSKSITASATHSASSTAERTLASASTHAAEETGSHAATSATTVATAPNSLPADTFMHSSSEPRASTSSPPAPTTEPSSAPSGASSSSTNETAPSGGGIYSAAVTCKPDNVIWHKTFKVQFNPSSDTSDSIAQKVAEGCLETLNESGIKYTNLTINPGKPVNGKYTNYGTVNEGSSALIVHIEQVTDSTGGISTVTVKFTHPRSGSTEFS